MTSFHPESYEKYAKRCLEGLVEYFPGKVIAYVESSTVLEGVETRDFFSTGFRLWAERAKRHPGTGGETHDGYKFKYDALKFCRKVFVQNAVFDEDEYVFWIDADSVIKKPIPEEFLKGLFKGTALCFLGRRNTYTETGFLGFHTKHPQFGLFRSNYLPWISSGRIFGQLEGWHDCIAFDHARQGVPGNDLSPKGRNYDSVMEQSVLHPYITHLKGNRKFDGAEPKIRWA